MKIISFAASNSRQSINRELLDYAASILDDTTVEFLDLNDYEMPIYSIDREHEAGIPKKAGEFLKKIEQCDALLISFAEHNGTYTAAFKNVLDWCSRINQKFYQNKPIVMLSTSPGQGGASSVLAQATKAAPFFDGNVVASLSIPSFYENFDSVEKKIVNETLAQQFENTIRQLPLVLQ